jgi:hypothetical protein
MQNMYADCTGTENKVHADSNIHEAVWQTHLEHGWPLRDRPVVIQHSLHGAKQHEFCLILRSHALELTAE